MVLSIVLSSGPCLQESFLMSKQDLFLHLATLRRVATYRAAVRKLHNWQGEMFLCHCCLSGLYLMLMEPVSSTEKLESGHKKSN